MTSLIPGCEDLVEIGADGATTVFRAWQPAFRRHVAVHLHLGRRLQDLEAGARRTAALADHPNVVTVHDLGMTDQGIPYLLTEVLDRGSLADHAPLDWHAAVSVTIKVAAVVEAARNAGIGGLAVTPGDVFLSRFGEPKVALFRRRTGADGTDADGLRSLLKALLGTGDCPSGVGVALSDTGLDASILVQRLQRAQEDGGLPVTEVPAETSANPGPGQPLPENFSELVTVAPQAPAEPDRRRAAWAAGAVLVVGASLGTATVLGRGVAPATTVPPAPKPAVVTSLRPPAPLLYDSAGFTGPEWKTVAGSDGLGVSRCDHDSCGGPTRSGSAAEYRIAVRGEWGVLVWRASGQRRVSISIAARIVQLSDFRLDVDCGLRIPGGKYLTGTIRPDASWEISANDRVLTSGSVPERQAELQEAFVLRMECVTDTTPTRAELFLNDVMLGAGDGTGSFPLNGVLFGTLGKDVYELAVSAVVIRRME